MGAELAESGAQMRKCRRWQKLPSRQLKILLDLQVLSKDRIKEDRERFALQIFRPSISMYSPRGVKSAFAAGLVWHALVDMSISGNHQCNNQDQPHMRTCLPQSIYLVGVKSANWRIASYSGFKRYSKCQEELFGNEEKR